MTNPPVFLENALSSERFLAKKATRDAYGHELVKLGHENSEIVALDADLSDSTRTGWFRREFPNRFFNAGIAEQNMIGMAAGLSLAGKIPFISSFAIFLTGRAWEPIRQSICYPNLNVKLVASHSGLTVGEDGASHQSLEDISIMRVLPNMRIFIPADATQTSQIIRYVSTIPGPVYVRTSRPATYGIFGPGYNFDPAQPDMIIQGEKILIITAGVLVAESILACEQLAKNGKYPSLLNLHTVKPFPADYIGKIINKYQALVTFEEHSIFGGIGSSVAEFVCANHPMPVHSFGTATFGKSGMPENLLRKFSLDSQGIARQVETIFDKY